MASLASCWLLVESFIIPDGFLKWFYLCFYIHPVFLVFCQMFLWLKELKQWLLFLFSPFTIAFRLSIFVFRFLKRVAFFVFSYTKPTSVDVFYDALEPDISQIHSQDREIVVSRSNSTRLSCQVVGARVQTGVFQMKNMSKVSLNDQNSCVKDSWLNEYLYSDHYNSSMSTYVVDMSESQLSSESIVSSPAETPSDKHDSTTSFRFSFSDQSVAFKFHEDSEISPSTSCDPRLLEDMLMISQEHSVSPVSDFAFNDSSSTLDECYTSSAADMLVDHQYLPPFFSSDSSVRPSKQHLISENIHDDVDPFHQKYTSRMRFFNILYQERLHGMNAILNEHSATPGLFTCNESSADLPRQFMLCSRMARKRLLRSLEYDLEMIYVAQSCLLWEAIHHQYQKIEALTISDNSENIVFHDVVAGKFQELQILLERFVEEQICECQKSSNNNTHKRLSFQGLLQVHDVTGFIFMEQENKIMRGEGIRAAELLEAINNCIKAFWLYIKTDEKKSLWKYKGIWRTNPPVEDPQDLELLYDVSKTLHKKGMMLKDVQGKKKCWLMRKVKPLQGEDEKRNLVFAMIDMKLVQRVLKMSLISTSHLKWCQEKLNNLDFKEGKIFRGRISHLFPSS